MSRSKVHYDHWDGGTESDQDHPEDLFCGTKCEDPEMSGDRNKVTCKRCLNILMFFGWRPKP
jgi:hypothetical protein